VSPRNGTVAPGRRTSPTGGLRDQNPPAFGVDVITVCPSYAVVDRWRSSFSGRRHSYLERSPTPCHVRNISASFLQSPEDASLPAFLPVTFVVSMKWLSLLDTLIVLVTYLLTYLLTCCILNENECNWVLGWLVFRHIPIGILCYLYRYCTTSYIPSLRIVASHDVTMMCMGIFHTYHCDILRCHNAQCRHVRCQNAVLFINDWHSGPRSN